MSTNKLAGCTVAFLVAAIGIVSPPGAFAQAGETDAGEFAVLGGGTFGISAHPAVTGAAGLALSRHAMALFETTYMAMGNHTIQNWPDKSGINRSYALDFGLNVHVRFPVKNRWEPYAIVGTGVLWNLIKENSQNRVGWDVVKHYDQFNGALHTGGGLRYYISHNWGIRPECKVIVSKNVYTQFMLGIFYVTPPDWP